MDLLERLTPALATRYRIERQLGRGGMATVYLAEDLRHGRLVALKVLRPEIGPALGADRFQREIEIASRLQHPHILSLHDSGEAGGLLYYTMPYVEGESLRSRLTREVQLDVAEAVQVAGETAEALECAHAAGDADATLKWLERAFETRVPALVFLAVDPRFDRLRGDPRYHDLLRRIGFPKELASRPAGRASEPDQARTQTE